MDNKSVMITGATDGLGKQVARDLAAHGAEVILHGRNKEKGQAVLREIQEATDNNSLSYFNADFSSLEEVRKMADRVQEEHEKLDVLINNAGIGFGDPGSSRELSRDGYELRFQVNYLAGFLLTIKLLKLLRQSSPARVVNVASAAQRAIDFDDIMLEDSYSGEHAYAQSKLAQIMFTFELAERLENSDITTNALHPATFMDTNMVREAGINPINTVDKGAGAVVYLATSSDRNGITGKYFNGKMQAKANSQAYDKDVRRKLWQLSEELTDIRANV